MVINSFRTNCEYLDINSVGSVISDWRQINHMIVQKVFKCMLFNKYATVCKLSVGGGGGGAAGLHGMVQLETIIAGCNAQMTRGLCGTSFTIIDCLFSGA